MVKKFLSLLAPVNCAVCARPLITEQEISCIVCQFCQQQCKIITGKVCNLCGKSLISEILTCTVCRNRNYAFGNNKAVFPYSEVAGLLAAYKFRAHRRVAYCLAPYIQKVYAKHYAGLPLVPIPSSKKGKRKRGFDQSLYLASILQRIYRIPVIQMLSSKSMNTQKTLNYDERLHNLVGNVMLKRHGKYKHLVLFDDVFTSGSTLHAYTELLITQGYTCDALTIAID